MNQEFQLLIRSEAHLSQAAAALAHCVQPSTLIGLVGTLGAGKTRFAQAFASACGISQEAVVSPTFVICHEYATPQFLLLHLDLYRIRSQEEIWDLGLDESWDAGSVLLVEWSDRFPESLPPEQLEIAIDITGVTTRTLRIRPFGSRMGIARNFLAGAISIGPRPPQPLDAGIQGLRREKGTRKGDRQ